MKKKPITSLHELRKGAIIIGTQRTGEKHTMIVKDLEHIEERSKTTIELIEINESFDIWELILLRECNEKQEFEYCKDSSRAMKFLTTPFTSKDLVKAIRKYMKKKR
ncbi:MAG: hypothetical protein WCJ45_08090 [bacterium]